MQSAYASKTVSWLIMLACCVGATVSSAGADDASPATRVDFDSEIRPILSDTCYHCHGPDANVRRAELRLDLEDAAFAERDGSPAIVRGHRNASELWKRITADDPAERMPPQDSGRSLTPAQTALLGRWIDEGAEWTQHWAFVAPQRPGIPVLNRSDWPKNDIDRFVLAKLEAAGLQPADEADRETLIRRVTFDLTGLPPTIAEIDAFLADQSPQAYEHVVDRLLNSPRFGERMAIDWLDLARYADTNGYQVDNERSVWRWRDWVISAFNSNMPFDQFTMEQIAGDLLPDATIEQRIATGFNRNHPTTFEGGVIPEEYRVEYVIDRVNTTSTVWLGLTLGCARCHDHKYDPFSQEDFYRLTGYFNNVPELGLDGAKGNSAPEIDAPTPEQTAELAALNARVAELESQLSAENPELDAAQLLWEQKVLDELPVRWWLLKPDSVTSSAGSTLTVLDDLSVLAGGPNPNADVYEMTATTDLERITGIRLEGLTHASLPGGGAGRHPNSNFVVTEVQLEAGAADDAATFHPIPFSTAHADYSQANYGIEKAIDGDLTPNTGWAVDGPTKRENRVAWLLPQQPSTFAGRTKLRIRIHNLFPQAAIGRFRISVTADPNPQEFLQAAAAQSGVEAAVAAILATPSDARTDEQRRRLRIHYRGTEWPDGKVIAEQIAAARARDAAVRAAIPRSMVMSEMPDPRETFVLLRGQYDQHGKKVANGVPGALHALPADAPDDRRGLALWLIDAANPLTARVTVNRFWQSRFGVGLVKTTEDFGVQGERPSHPALLDWLAVEFVESGWDVQHVVRLIATSATYRQSSHLTGEMLRHDPENRLLARGPRHRLSAEFIRDNALAVSGLLVNRIGGRSVKPYQPPGLWKEISSGSSYSAQIFEQDTGDALYRRSLYTFWKRASPPPALQMFDAPTREYCVVGRSRTNTPLQALVLMNDPTYVEASRALAQRVILEADPGVGPRIVLAFRLTTGRHPEDTERQVLQRLYANRLAEFQADAESAEKLLSVGEFQPDPSLDRMELAAWTTVAGVLLNLGETITRP